MAQPKKKAPPSTVTRRSPPSGGTGPLIVLTDSGRKSVGAVKRRGGDIVATVTAQAKPAAGGFGGGVLASLVSPLLPDTLGVTGKAIATTALGIAGAAVLKFPPSVVAGIAGAAGSKWFDGYRGRRATDRPPAK